MTWGTMYFAEKAAWDNLPLETKLAASGFVTVNNDGAINTYAPESRAGGLVFANGAYNYYDAYGAGTGTGDPRQSGDYGGSPEVLLKWYQDAVAWNTRGFVLAHNVLPLDAPYSGNGTYTDASVASQGHGNLLQWGSFVSGDPNWQAGNGVTIVNDALIGRVMVPKPGLVIDPYRDFASHNRGFINTFFDNGGGVALAVGGILSISGVFNVLGDLISQGAGSVTSNAIQATIPDASTAVNTAVNTVADTAVTTTETVVNAVDTATQVATSAGTQAAQVIADTANTVSDVVKTAETIADTTGVIPNYVTAVTTDGVVIENVPILTAEDLARAGITASEAAAIYGTGTIVTTLGTVSVMDQITKALAQQGLKLATGAVAAGAAGSGGSRGSTSAAHGGTIPGVTNPALQSSNNASSVLPVALVLIAAYLFS